MDKDLPQDFETAKARLSTAVYEATRLLEELEYAGKVHGNGHHLRQKVAAFATSLLTERWKDQKPSDTASISP